MGAVSNIHCTSCEQFLFYNHQSTVLVSSLINFWIFRISVSEFSREEATEGTVRTSITFFEWMSWTLLLLIVGLLLLSAYPSLATSLTFVPFSLFLSKLVVSFWSRHPGYRRSVSQQYLIDSQLMMNRRVITQCVKIYTSALRRSTTSSPNLATLHYAEKVEAS